MSAKTDVVVKLVLVFFISLLSFSIGTFVGKKYSDNQHKLAALEPGHGEEHGAREVASATEGEHGVTASEDAKGHGTAAAGGESMSDEEIAKLAEEFVSDDTTATSNAAAGGEHGATAPAAGEHKAVAATGHGAAAAHSEEAAVAPAKTRSLEKAEPLAAAKKIVQARIAEDNRVPSSIPKDVSQYNVGKFTVQVGSYAKEDEAQRVAGDLKAKGYSAYYIPANVKGQTWYRVSVGLFATPREAQAYRAELMAKSKITSAIVQKIIQ
jgi:cell division protein FtsN